MGLPATGMQTAMRHGGRADSGPGEGGWETESERQRYGARNRDRQGVEKQRTKKLRGKQRQETGRY